MQLQQAKTQAELQMDAQEAQREQEQLQSGGTTPHMATATSRIVEAKIRAASAMSVEQSRANSELAYATTEAQMARDNAVSRRQESADKRELMILEYSLKNNLTLEQVKAQLAQTAMQEQTKRELAGVDSALQASEGHQNRVVDLHKTSTELAAQERLAAANGAAKQVAKAAVEPVGKAPDGKAFQA